MSAAQWDLNEFDRVVPILNELAVAQELRTARSRLRRDERKPCNPQLAAADHYFYPMTKTVPSPHRLSRKLRRSGAKVDDMSSTAVRPMQNWKASAARLAHPRAQ